MHTRWIHYTGKYLLWVKPGGTFTWPGCLVNDPHFFDDLTHLKKRLRKQIFTSYTSFFFFFKNKINTSFHQ